MTKLPSHDHKDKKMTEKEKHLREASKHIVADISESAKHVAMGKGKKQTIKPVSTGFGEKFNKIEVNNQKLKKYENDAVKTAKMVASNVIMTARRSLGGSDSSTPVAFITSTAESSRAPQTPHSSQESKDVAIQVTKEVGGAIPIRSSLKAGSSNTFREKQMDFAYSVVTCAQTHAVKELEDGITEEEKENALRRVASDIIKDAIEDAKTLIAVTKHSELSQGHRNSIALYGTEREGPVGMTFHHQPLPHSLDAHSQSTEGERGRLPVLHHGLSPRGSDAHIPFKPGETPWKIQKSVTTNSEKSESASVPLESVSSIVPLNFDLPSEISFYPRADEAPSPAPREPVPLRRPPPFKPYHDPASYQHVLPEHQMRLPRLRFNELPGNRKNSTAPRDNKSVKVGMVCPRAPHFTEDEVMTNSLYVARRWYRNQNIDCNDWDRWTSLYRTRRNSYAVAAQESSMSGNSLVSQGMGGGMSVRQKLSHIATTRWAEEKRSRRHR